MTDLVEDVAAGLPVHKIRASDLACELVRATAVAEEYVNGSIELNAKQLMKIAITLKSFLGRDKGWEVSEEEYKNLLHKHSVFDGMDVFAYVYNDVFYGATYSLLDNAVARIIYLVLEKGLV